MVSILEVESSVFYHTLIDPILTQKWSKLGNFGPKMTQNKDLSDLKIQTLGYPRISPPKIAVKRISAHRPMGF